MITLLLHVLLSSYQLSRMTGWHDRHYKKISDTPCHYGLYELRKST